MKRRVSVLLLSLFVGTLAGCAPSKSEDEGLATGPLMLPGDNCRSCHGAPASSYPAAPDWTVAGTVFEAQDSDVGAAGVQVEIVDSQGKVEVLTTNLVGNFYTGTPFQTPYWVTLSKDGLRVTMPVPPPSGGCNACHRVPAVGNAPGKLYLPPEGSFVSLAQCDGEQTVTIGTSEYDCAPYRCRGKEGAMGARCLGTCEDSGDCATGFTCEGERCTAL